LCFLIPLFFSELILVPPSDYPVKKNTLLFSGDFPTPFLVSSLMDAGCPPKALFPVGLLVSETPAFNVLPFFQAKNPLSFMLITMGSLSPPFPGILPPLLCQPIHPILIHNFPKSPFFASMCKKHCLFFVDPVPLFAWFIFFPVKGAFPPQSGFLPSCFFLPSTPKLPL